MQLDPAIDEFVRKELNLRLFLTGGTGFIGSHFLRHSLAAGHEVVALKRPDSKTKVELDWQPRWLECNYLSLDEHDFEGIDCLVHLAAHSVQYPFDSLQNCMLFNVIEPFSMFQAAVRAGVKRFVIAGSCFEYGLSACRHDAIPPSALLLPTNCYGVSKASASLAFTQLAIEHRLHLSIHRLFHVYGEGEPPNRFWPSLVECAKTGRDFRMTTGTQIRDFIHVGTAAAQLLLAVESIPNVDMPYIKNIGSGIARTLAEFAESEWSRLEAKGRLCVGAISSRAGEDERLVADIKSLYFPSKDESSL